MGNRNQAYLKTLIISIQIISTIVSSFKANNAVVKELLLTTVM
jgi:hypothetical protein